MKDEWAEQHLKNEKGENSGARQAAPASPSLPQEKNIPLIQEIDGIKKTLDSVTCNLKQQGTQFQAENHTPLSHQKDELIAQQAQIIEQLQQQINTSSAQSQLAEQLQNILAAGGSLVNNQQNKHCTLSLDDIIPRLEAKFDSIISSDRLELAYSDAKTFLGSIGNMTKRDQEDFLSKALDFLSMSKVVNFSVQTAKKYKDKNIKPFATVLETPIDPDDDQLPSLSVVEWLVKGMREVYGGEEAAKDHHYLNIHKVAKLLSNSISRNIAAIPNFNDKLSEFCSNCGEYTLFEDSAREFYTRLICGSYYIHDLDPQVIDY